MDYFNQQDVSNYASFLYNLSGTDLALLATTVGLILSQNINSDQINSLGNFLDGVGQIMLVIGAQQQLRENQNNEK